MDFGFTAGQLELRRALREVLSREVVREELRACAAATSSSPRATRSRSCGANDPGNSGLNWEPGGLTRVLIEAAGRAFRADSTRIRPA
jgi:hypothetical protein